MDKIATAPARSVSPVPIIAPEEALPRPVRLARSARQPRRSLAWMRGTLTLGALCYALLATACAAAVIASGASWRLVSPIAGLCALAACVAEWMASRRAALPARDLALAVYVAGALLLPAPWAVLVVVVAALVSLPARRGLSATALLATTAHTVLAVTVFTVASHVALGDGQVWRDSAVFAGNPAALPRALSSGATMPTLAAGQPWYGAAFYTPRPLAVLLFLCGAYYLLETVPPALLCAVARRRHPWRVWSDLYGHAVPLQLVALPLAPTLVALDTAAPALALLALPLPIGAAWIAVALHRARVVADEAGVLRENTAALYTRAAAAEERARRGDASAEALLAAIRGIGGNDDLVEVTATLARAATRLTHFRTCVVYLYESRDGAFVACADQLQGARRGEVVSRARVEALMAPRHLLGYSYYAPRPGHDNADTEQGVGGGGAALGPWQDGAALLTPLLLKNGDVIGYIRLDRPSDRRVPSAAELTPLETLAFLAASVIARLRHTDEVLHLAASDGLTGLLNRRAFEEHLQRELAAAARRKRPLALMMIDIDDFGAVNNTYGHQVGDAALRLVAGVIHEHLRESDAGGRYGGDEFTVVLPELDTARAADIAERLRAALAAATERAAADGSLPQLFTSIGVAAWPQHAGSVSELIKAADDALYASKRRVRPAIVMVDSGLTLKGHGRPRTLKGLPGRGDGTSWRALMGRSRPCARSTGHISQSWGTPPSAWARTVCR